jgi:hypothetical protein
MKSIHALTTKTPMAGLFNEQSVLQIRHFVACDRWIAIVEKLEAAGAIAVGELA